MSGAVEISPQATWLPSGWIFGDALQRLAAAVPAEAQMLEYAQEVFSYADLRELPPERLAPLAEAARGAVRDVIDTGPPPGEDPTWFRQHVNGLSLLAGLLSADPRAGYAAPPGVLELATDTTWTAPGPAYTLVCEHLAGALRPVSGLLALRLLEPEPTLGILDEPTFRTLLPTVEWMADTYVPERRYVAAADAFFADVAPHVATLLDLLRADPRS